MDSTLRFASTDAEREAIYRLRYDIYIGEMHFEDAADHEQRRMSDLDDATAHLLYISEDAQVIGTLRLNFGADAPFSEESATMYDLDRFRAIISDAQIAIFTRFMVRKPYRGTHLSFHMLAELARFTSQSGIEAVFCDCQPHLLGLYTSLGFRSYTETYDDPYTGIMVPLVFVTGDTAYLERIQSPLRSFVSPSPASVETARRIARVLGETFEDRSGADEAAERWAEVYSLLSHRPAHGLHLFNGLSPEAIRAVVAKSHLIDCAPGNRVIARNQGTHTIFMVLAGAVEVRVGDHVVRVLAEGGVVGEVAFLLGIPRTADVFAAAQGARVLSIQEKMLQQLIEESPEIASVVLHNLSKLLAFKLAETANRVYGAAVAA
jgi:predicted GNAT family N-acyltransferase